MTARMQEAQAAPVGGTEARLAERLFRRLRESAFDGVGITRLAYSEEETAALDIVEAEARSLGLETTRDAAANLVVTLAGRAPDLPAIACGSHIDSVPQGGNFDGAAGIVAGLAMLARFRREGFTPRRTVRLYALRGEESARFGRPYIGSSALMGQLSAADLASPAADSGRPLADCMQDVGADVPRIARGGPLVSAAGLAAWLELHIEQGPVLVARGAAVGIVTGVRGNIRHRTIECIGEAGHSGTVPRGLRHDAIFAAAELITRLDHHWRTLIERGRDIVITTGIFGTDPQQHAIARIPGRVRFSLDLRSQSARTLEAAYGLFRSECTLIEDERGVSFALDRRVESSPAQLDPLWIARLKAAAQALHLPDEELPSGAGHDAAVFAHAGVPSAMIFVRNRNGSHNPDEDMDLADFLAGLDVLAKAVREAVE